MKYGEMQQYYREGKFAESRTVSVLYGVFLALFAFFFIIVPLFIFQTVPVLQQSMYPTIHGGEPGLFFEDKVGLSLLSGYGRGDIVVFDRSEGAGESEKRLIKRVLALPGDRIRIAERDGAEAIQIETKTGEGSLTYWLEEPYLNPDNTYKLANPSGAFTKTLRNGWLELGEDEYFVAGDNRESSLDSFSFGPIRKQKILGKAVCIFTKCGKFLSLNVYKAKDTGATVNLIPAQE